MRDDYVLAHLREKFSGHDCTGFSYFDFLHAQGSPSDALFYSRLFWPEFVEIEDMIFMEGTIENAEDRVRLKSAYEKYEHDKTATEQDFNFVEVAYLFGRNLSEISEAEYLLLAERLAEMWRCRLHKVFPERKFSVEIVEPPDNAGEDIGIVFHTIRNDKE